jgi:hypothetical protein
MTALDPRIKDVGEIQTRHLFDIVVDLQPRLPIGGPLGDRVLFVAAGGSFSGPDLRGSVLATGGDWAVFRPDGTMTLDVRLTLQTEDGALIFMSYGGRWVIPPEVRSDMVDASRRHEVDPARYYFRTNPLFETGSSDYAWLNDVVAVGSGYLAEAAVAYRVAQVL